MEGNFDVIMLLTLTYFNFSFNFCAIPGTAKSAPENPLSEFEAKSGRDGAWLV